MAILRDTLEIAGPACVMRINQQDNQIVFVIEGWIDDGNRQFFARLELDPKDAVQLASYVENAANIARKIQD